jgi:2-oxoglutarate ferredoxin oxidoreductase subunit alpha
MDEIKLMKGNEAMAEAAIRAGCDAYFGYPITPQSEILEYLSQEMVKRGGLVLQAESEVASINMVYGAAGAGARVMTTSSSPGISLMQEGISYITAAELPCLLVNIQRGGPGLGTIQPSQADYFQATKGGGHGDYHLIVLAPNSVQEMSDFVYDGFDLADKYRNPVMILADGALGQMMEKVKFKEYDSKKRSIPGWASTGKTKDRERNIITTLFIQPERMELQNKILQEKYKLICDNEVKYESIQTEDAEFIFVAYGLSARIGHKAQQILRKQGVKAGLLRPITLYPYPYGIINKLSDNAKAFLVLELNAGQMIEDVKLAVNGKTGVHFFGKMGGIIPSPEEVVEEMNNIIKKS